MPLTRHFSMNKFEKTLRFIKETIGEESVFYRKIYLVGGCVRDELLGERYTDLDLLIDMPDGQKKFVEYMCTTYPKICKGPFYYQRYGTTAMDVVIDGFLTLVECVEPHIEQYDTDGKTLLETRFCTLEEDALRRDYTCNALYKNLHTDQVLDPTRKGLEDLNEGLLRTPLDARIIYKQDPVRMLRGIRFKHQKGFKLDEEAWQAIVENHDEMQIAAPKRVRDELNKLLKTRTFGEAINDLWLCGLLHYVMPGLSEHLDDETHLEILEENMTLWQHTRLALYVLTSEHPYINTQSKLIVLMADIADRYGLEEVTELLRKAQIGKDRIGSIIHYIEMYQRFTSFYENGEYIARPRALPHFIVGLGNIKTDFRRIIRALNHGRKQDFVLPYEVLYDNKGQSESPGNRNKNNWKNGQQTNSNPNESKEKNDKKRKNHRRNVKRREQRKRAKARKRELNNAEGAN